MVVVLITVLYLLALAWVSVARVTTRYPWTE
jgi:hypothetical protein